MCDFDNIRTLGQGTFGTVVLARKKPNNKQYAIKLTKNSFCNENGLGISPNEYTILLNVKHRNLANAKSTLKNKTIENCYPDFKIGILSKVALGDLRNIYSHDYIDVAAVLYDVACGIEALHEAGYYHLDIKAANCLLYKDDEFIYRAVLSDFGLSIDRSKRDCRRPKCTITHRPPEIADVTYFQLNPYIDVFSFGVLMAELTVGGISYDAGLSEEENINENIQSILSQCKRWREFVNKVTAIIEDENSTPEEIEKQTKRLDSKWGGIGGEAMLQIISQIEMALSVDPLKRGTIKEHREMLEEIGFTENYVKAELSNNKLNDITSDDFSIFNRIRRIMKLDLCKHFPVRMLFSAFHIYMLSKASIEKFHINPYYKAFAFLSVASHIYDVDFDEEENYFDIQKELPLGFHEDDLDKVHKVMCKVRDTIEKGIGFSHNFNSYNAFDTCKNKEELMNLVNSKDISVLKTIYFKDNVITQRENAGNDLMQITMVMIQNI